MRSALLAPVLAVALAGCAGSTMKAQEPVELTAAQKAVIETSVRNRLKDPESARFSDYRAGRSGEGVTVCGFVNAKNSFGGYTGGAPFYGLLSGDRFSVIQMDDPNPGGSRWASNMCAQVGLMGWL